MRRPGALRLAAVVLIALGALVTASACTGTAAERWPPPRPGTLPEPPRLDTAAEVWPEAVFTLPARLRNGPTVRPVAMLNENEVLMVTPFTLASLVAYDRRTGRHRVLATAPEWGECSLCYEVGSVAVSRERIAWVAGVYRSEPWNAGKRHLELWTMPRSGGQMRMVTWLTGHDDFPLDTGLSIEGDHAVWDREGDAYRISLTAADPVKAPILAGTRPAKEPGAKERGLRDLYCGAEWCVGRTPPRPYELTTLAVERRDGSDRTTVTASSLDEPLIGDRFGFFGLPYVYDDGPVHISTGGPEASAILYDRCTGESALIGTRAEDDPAEEIGRGAVGPDAPILFWSEEEGKRYRVLDLSRIPGQPCGG